MTREIDETPVSVAEVDSPIINSPFSEPKLHWKIEHGKNATRVSGRRRASYFYRVPGDAKQPRRSRIELNLFESDIGQEVELDAVNIIRERLREWRSGLHTGVPYDGVTDTTRELLDHWHSDNRLQPLFYAQIEAAETIIFLLEAHKSYKSRVPKIPGDVPKFTSKSENFRSFKRYACKMATGTGKTTVMGMLAAWSILNRVASPHDNRFSDTVLVVCPNVTIRERLKELDLTLGDQSIYRTRQIVPTHRMTQLRQGEVLVTNWHLFARQESNFVNGESYKVVKSGCKVETVVNAGRKDEKTKIVYYESDSAWFRRIRRRLGAGKGRSPHWLIFNDEAHHAYRREHGGIREELESDVDTAKADDKKATVWIEGLDKINKLQGGTRRNGIKMCIDLSATPYYIRGSGNDVGKPFPWIVSDFGLFEAIESGLVKVPQLVARDESGSVEPRYFNIWKWIEDTAYEKDRIRQLGKEVVLRYASAPINLLAADWEERFHEWERLSKKRNRHPVPPVFVIVCRDTTIAKEVYDWVSGGTNVYGRSPILFRNTKEEQVTVRIDSKVLEDIEMGGTKHETRKLRYILETIGKAEWPGRRVPEDWSSIVRHHNDKVLNDIGYASEELIDEEIPPGRDIRCIVSVSMLSEGWDANNVTHIVGLRPFGTQLLCEQVVGRALRRKSYLMDPKTKMFTEEKGRILGVPFELVPFKVSKTKKEPPELDYTYIFSDPDKVKYRITFPIVIGYHPSGGMKTSVDWNLVSRMTIDSADFPSDIELQSLSAPSGFVGSDGVGNKTYLTLDEWRRRLRRQQVAFCLATEICRRCRKTGDLNDTSEHLIFSTLFASSKKFIDEMLVLKGRSKSCDILFVGQYMQKAVDILVQALTIDQDETYHQRPIILPGASGQGSTSNVEFPTPKPTCEAIRCHLNLMVADTKVWEQRAAYLLDRHPGVERWVKNDHLNFRIPYWESQVRRDYFPDFIVVTDTGMQVIVEVKGRETDNSDAKAAAARRWVAAINDLTTYGSWDYVVVTELEKFSSILDNYCSKKSTR